MSPLEEDAVNLTQQRAYIYVGNVNEFCVRRDWMAAEGAARMAIGELQTMVTAIVIARERADKHALKSLHDSSGK